MAQAQFPKLHGLDLCSGIGGITLGIQDYVRPIAYCEKDSFCQKLLEARFNDGILPRSPIFEDVKDFPYDNFIGEVDVVYSGFPCQDISIAGRGKGLDGERSSIFYDVLHIATKIRSPFIFFENVAQITRRGLWEVTQNLAYSRYDCRWLILPASHLGAPHQRRRWFLLAYSHGFARVRLQSKGWNETPFPSFNGNQGPMARPTTWLETDWWSTKPSIRRVAHGLPNRVHRLKALGNAVVPLQAKVAFEQLMGIKDERYFDTQSQ